LATAVVRYSAAAITDRGRKRGSNEDAFGYSVEHGVYLVCDGMGGAAAGEVASSLAVEEVLRHITQKRESDLREAPASLSLIAEEAVASANHTIHSRSQLDQKLSGMGTTLVGLLTSEPDESSGEPDESAPRIWILNVGDSRCYRLRQRRLEQCTRDHSVVEEQVRLGRMTREEATRSPLRNLITRVIGTQSSVTPDIIEVQVEPGDLFLLCSDGLHTELSDSKIESLLNTATSAHLPLEEHCQRLIQAANKAGGHDNITCLLVRVD
jgi:PPM family protein phosphatase